MRRAFSSGLGKIRAYSSARGPSVINANNVRLKDINRWWEENPAARCSPEIAVGLLATIEKAENKKIRLELKRGENKSEAWSNRLDQVGSDVADARRIVDDLQQVIAQHNGKLDSQSFKDILKASNSVRDMGSPVSKEILSAIKEFSINEACNTDIITLYNATNLLGKENYNCESSLNSFQRVLLSRSDEINASDAIRLFIFFGFSALRDHSNVFVPDERLFPLLFSKVTDDDELKRVQKKGSSIHKLLDVCRMLEHKKIYEVDPSTVSKLGQIFHAETDFTSLSALSFAKCLRGFSHFGLPPLNDVWGTDMESIFLSKFYPAIQRRVGKKIPIVFADSDSDILIRDDAEQLGDIAYHFICAYNQPNGKGPLAIHSPFLIQLLCNVFATADKMPKDHVIKVLIFESFNRLTDALRMSDSPKPFKPHKPHYFGPSFEEKRRKPMRPNKKHLVKAVAAIQSVLVNQKRISDHVSLRRQLKFLWVILKSGSAFQFLISEEMVNHMCQLHIERPHDAELVTVRRMLWNFDWTAKPPRTSFLKWAAKTLSESLLSSDSEYPSSFEEYFADRQTLEQSYISCCTKLLELIQRSSDVDEELQKLAEEELVPAMLDYWWKNMDKIYVKQTLYMMNVLVHAYQYEPSPQEWEAIESLYSSDMGWKNLGAAFQYLPLVKSMTHQGVRPLEENVVRAIGVLAGWQKTKERSTEKRFSEESTLNRLELIDHLKWLREESPWTKLTPDITSALCRVTQDMLFGQLASIRVFKCLSDESVATFLQDLTELKKECPDLFRDDISKGLHLCLKRLLKSRRNGRNGPVEFDVTLLDSVLCSLDEKSRSSSELMQNLNDIVSGAGSMQSEGLVRCLFRYSSWDFPSQTSDKAAHTHNVQLVETLRKKLDSEYSSFSSYVDNVVENGSNGAPGFDHVSLGLIFNAFGELQRVPQLEKKAQPSQSFLTLFEKSLRDGAREVLDSGGAQSGSRGAASGLYQEEIAASIVKAASVLKYRLPDDFFPAIYHVMSKSMHSSQHQNPQTYAAVVMDWVKIGNAEKMPPKPVVDNFVATLLESALLYAQAGTQRRIIRQVLACSWAKNKAYGENLSPTALEAFERVAEPFIDEIEAFNLVSTISMYYQAMENYEIGASFANQLCTTFMEKRKSGSQRDKTGRVMKKLAALNKQPSSTLKANVGTFLSQVLGQELARAEEGKGNGSVILDLLHAIKAWGVDLSGGTDETLISFVTEDKVDLEEKAEIRELLSQVISWF